MRPLPRRRTPVDPRRRGALRGLVVVTGLATALGGYAAYAESAHPAPVDALQSVDLTLAGDGTVTSMKRTDVVSTENGKIEQHDGDLAPAAASKLPVALTTSWVYDGHTGTDFADVKGKSGRIELSLTLTNTTTHVEPFSVAAGDRNLDTYAMVSTPVTVVGAVNLGDLSGAKVVRSTSGKEEAGTTNGAVTTGDDTEVQWSAVLAPPRLAPSATFRVVVDAKDFKVPEFHVSAQAGLVSDPSVEALFAQAFGSRSPIAQVQQTTAALTDSLSKQLVATSSLLTQIRGTLDTNADTAGPAATAELQAAAKAAVSDLTGSISALTDINSDVARSIGDARDAGAGTLANALKSMQDFVGVPKDWTKESDFVGPARVSGCDPMNPVDPKGSLYDQLHQIREVLYKVSAASAACVADAKANLDGVLGTLEHRDGAGNVTQEATDCASISSEPIEDQPLICRFGVTQSKIDAIQVALVNVATGHDSSLKGSRDTLASKLASLVSAVDDVQQQTAALSLQPVDRVVGDLTDLQTVLANLNTKKTDLVKALENVLPDAQTNAGALSDKVDALRTQVCDEPSLDPAAIAADTTGIKDSVDSYRSELRDLVDTGATVDTCAAMAPSTASAEGDLDSLVAADQANWDAVQDALDAATGGSGPSLTQLISSLTTQVTDLLDSFGDGGDFTDELADLGTDACKLFHGDAAAVSGGDSSTDASNYSGCDDSLGAGPLDQLSLAIEKLNSDTRNKLNKDWSDEVNKQFEPVTGIITDAKQATDEANTDADSLLGKMLSDLQKSIEQSAENLTAHAAGGLHETLYGTGDPEGFATSIAKDTTSLNTTMNAAINLLGAEIKSSQGSLATTRDNLSKAINAALGELNGVIGLMGDQSDQVGTGQDQIGDVQNEASGFGSVRRGDQLDQALASMQLDRGLQLVPDLPWFGDSLPEGSQHTSLMTFVIKGDA